MRLRLLISLSPLLLAWQTSLAQLAPADDFFHGGAQLYITNNIPAAKEVVAQGRKLYPDDEKLKKLEELLNQKQQQQNQQQQDQKDQQQQSQNDQQQKSDEQKKQPPQEPKDSPQKKDDEKKQADQKKGEEQKKAEQKKDSADKSKDESQEKQEAQPVKPGEMTPEEAKHLLDAQKGKEQLLQLKPPEKPRNNSRPVKDW